MLNYLYKYIFLFIIVVTFPLFSQEKEASFTKQYNTFLKKYLIKGFINYQLLAKNQQDIKSLIEQLKTIQVIPQQLNKYKAFWINAYNLTAIYQIIQKYPVPSPKSIAGFFNKIQNTIALEKLTLDEIEHQKLLKIDRDPRIHFALVCVAKGCPRLFTEAYEGSKLEKQLNSKTKITLEDTYFVTLNAKKKQVFISELFRWYINDFKTKSPDLITYFNRYRKNKIPTDYQIKWKTYNWALNDVSSGGGDYDYFDSSSLLGKGNLELKSWNTLYTQNELFTEKSGRVDQGFRTTYYSSFTGFYYGLTGAVNLGLDLVYKSVHIGQGASSAFTVFNPQSNSNSHAALVSITPKVKFALSPKIDGLTMQVLLYIPTGRNFEGNVEPKHPFLEWDAWQLWLDLYYYLPVGQLFSFFFSGGIFPRIGWLDSSSRFGVSGYFKIHFQYVATSYFTLYAVTEILGALWNLGLGMKFFVARSFGIDISYVGFVAGRNTGAGHTYAIGLSYIY